jgi:ribosomal protein L11 methyltransferase
MTYRELTFYVTEDSAELLGDTLMELGALSITVEDAQADTAQEIPLYGEPGMVISVEAWQESKVIALFNQSLWTEFAQHTEAILAELDRLGMAIDHYTEAQIEEQDWVKLTQSQFDPIAISDRIWVVPSWHDTPQDLHPQAICLAVDPGLAFGTGSHPTTKLCLNWLESLSDANLLQNQSVMDYGCGSGILAIAAKKLGSGATFGLDIDPQSVTASTDNAIRNEVTIVFGLPDMITDTTKFNVVVANILANPLKILAPAIGALVAPSGYLALSGILEQQAEQIIEIYAPWVDLKIWQVSDGWVCLAGKSVT